MGTATMTDETIHSGEFNAALEGIRTAIDALSQRMAGVESLQQAGLVAKVDEAHKAGMQEANLLHIEKRLDRVTLALGALVVGFSGQLLWWVFTKMAH